MATAHRPGTGRRSARALGVGAVLLSVAVVASACGARLGSTQLQAARARGTGTGLAAGTAGGSGAGGAAASGASGGTTSGTTGAGATGATGAGTSGGGTAAGGTGGATGATGAGARTSGGATGATGGSATATTAASGVNPFGGAPAGGNGGATDTGVTATSITLGNVSTQGGPVPGLFSGAYYGALAYADYVNSQGGIYGRQLKVSAQDDQLNASQNKAATDQLLGKVLGFLGSFSLETNAGSPDIQAAGAPNVSYAIDTTTQAQSTNFSPQPLGNGFASGAYQYFGAKFGPSVASKAAFFIEDNPTAIAAADQEQAMLLHTGYQIVYSRKVEATETNFQGDVTNMQQKGVKAIFFQGEVSTLARMAAAMHDAGFKVPFANWGAPAYDPGFISLAQGGADGAILTQQLAMYEGEDASTVPEVALFDTWMHRVAPSQTIDLYAAYSWAAGALLTQALIKAGPKVTRKSVLAALSSIKSFNDNGMVATADPADKTPPTGWIAIDVQGGKFVRDPATPSGFKAGSYYG